MELSVYYCLLEFFGGILMQIGGSVPGVSGGTIAFLMGFYDNMINSLNNLFVKDKKLRLRSFIHLVIIGVGFLIGLAIATLLINRFFVDHIYAISSAFIGIALFSTPLIVREEWSSIRSKPFSLLWIIPGAALIIGLTILANMVFKGVTGWAQILLMVPVGILGSAAMFMPGISGASILHIFGQYTSVYSAIGQFVGFEKSFPFVRLDFSVFPYLAAFGIGIVIGVVVAVKAIRWLLRNQRARTICAIVGMMLGSIYSMWVGPRTLEPPKEIMSFSTFNWWLFLAGGALIVLFEAMKILVETKNKKKAAAAETDEETMADTSAVTTAEAAEEATDEIAAEAEETAEEKKDAPQ